MMIDIIPKKTRSPLVVEIGKKPFLGYDLLYLSSMARVTNKQSTKENKINVWNVKYINSNIYFTPSRM